MAKTKKKKEMIGEEEYSFLRNYNYSLIKEFKHPFGNFREVLYKRCEKDA
jgi:hypothetical protein